MVGVTLLYLGVTKGKDKVNKVILNRLGLYLVGPSGLAWDIYL